MKEIDRLYSDLDTVLKFFHDDKEGFYLSHREVYKKTKIGDTCLHTYYLCDKLYKDGFVNTDFPSTEVKSTKRPNKTKKIYDYTEPMYLINYNGMEFYLQGGYKNKRKLERRKQTWVVVKTIAAVLNAVAIIGISVFTLMAN